MKEILGLGVATLCPHVVSIGADRQPKCESHRDCEVNVKGAKLFKSSAGLAEGALLGD
jgi:hypothetical protein